MDPFAATSSSVGPSSGEILSRSISSTTTATTTTTTAHSILTSLELTSSNTTHTATRLNRPHIQGVVNQALHLPLRLGEKIHAFLAKSGSLNLEERAKQCAKLFVEASQDVPVAQNPHLLEEPPLLLLIQHARGLIAQGMGSSQIVDHLSARYLDAALEALLESTTYQDRRSQGEPREWKADQVQALMALVTAPKLEEEAITQLQELLQNGRAMQSLNRFLYSHFGECMTLASQLPHLEGRSPQRLEEAVRSLLQLTYYANHMRDLEALAHDVRHKIEAFMREGTVPHFTREDIWLLEHLVSESRLIGSPGEPKYDENMGLIKMILAMGDAAPPLFQNLNFLHSHEGACKEIAAKMHKGSQTGDISIWDQERMERFRIGPQLNLDLRSHILQLFADSRIGHSEVIVRKADQSVHSLGIWDREAGGLKLTPALFYLKYVSLNYRVRVEALLTSAAKNSLQMLPDEVESLFSQVFEYVAFKWQGENKERPEAVANRLARRLTSVLPHPFSKHETLEEIGHMTNEMICTELTFRLLVRALLKFEKVLRVRLGDTAPPQILDLPFDRRYKMKGFNTKEMLRLLQTLIDDQKVIILHQI